MVAKPGSKKKKSVEDNFDGNVGETIYFYHPENAWVKGTLEDIKENRFKKKLYVCSPSDQPMEKHEVAGRKVTRLREEDLDASNITDLLDMRELSEASLLHVLKNRFLDDFIYTKIGPIVVSINPFKWTIPYCQHDAMDDYINQKSGSPPHCWHVADACYRNMMENKGNQVILISGESGAGKTECCKSVIRYISKLSFKLSNNDSGAVKSTITQQIQESSPILEAFGNAKTINNDNSSRFGKFIKLQFNNAGNVLGAHITNYLLEKSRINAPGPNERSYHVFYQLIRGLTAEERERWHLNSIEDFPNLTAGSCTSVDGMDDVEEYKILLNAMKVVGMSQKTIENIFQTVAAVLHLLKIEFDENADEQSNVRNPEQIKLVSSLLGVSSEKLNHALTTKTLIIMKKEIVSPIDANAANAAKVSMANTLYANLFDFIIKNINKHICSESCDRFVGLLDIFGFETFEVNSFEQFCINFANETLQYHYNTFNFQRDIAECKAEGLDVTSINPPNNAPCIHLIRGRNRMNPGVFAILDETIRVNAKDLKDVKFRNAVAKRFESHSHFAPHKHDPMKFLIKHYAGDIYYDVDGWMIKNMDELKHDIVATIQSSTIPFISSLLNIDESKKRSKTVGGFFTEQLNQLMEIINSCNPRWIRCIKSHPSKKPNRIHGRLVMEQLRSSGVLETVRIRREGYCYRIPLQEFYGKYRIVAGDSETFPQDDASLKKACDGILRSSTLQLSSFEAQVGSTKVFLRVEGYRKLSAVYDKAILSHAVTLSQFARMRIAKRKVFDIKEAIRREKLRSEMEARRADIELLQSLERDVHFVDSIVVQGIEYDNTNLRLLKEQAANRIDMLQIEYQRNMEIKDIVQRVQKEQAELERQEAIARQQEIERLRAENELLEEKRRIERAARAKQKAEDEYKLMVRLMEQKRQESIKMQQEERNERRRDYIKKRQEKIDRLRRSREMIQQEQQEAFDQSRSRIEEEKEIQEMERQQRVFVEKSQNQYTENAIQEFERIEEERLRSMLEKEAKEHHHKYELDLAQRARINYQKKLALREQEALSRELERKDRRTSTVLRTIQLQKELEVKQRAQERRERARRVKERLALKDQIVTENQSRFALKKSLEQVSKRVRKKVVAENQVKMAKMERQYHIKKSKFEVDSKTFESMLDKKRYEQTMQRGRELHQADLQRIGSPRRKKESQFRTPRATRSTKKSNRLIQSARRPFSPRDLYANF